MTSVVPEAGAAHVSRSTKASRAFGGVAIAGAIVLATLPTWGDASTMRKMVELLTLVAVAQIWNLLAGFAGVKRFGHRQGVIAQSRVPTLRPLGRPLGGFAGMALNAGVGRAQACR